MKKEGKKTGKIDFFFETGCEGLIWIFSENGKKGWNAFNQIENGDYLKIYREDGSVAFDGIIKEDYKTGWKRHYKYARHGQPAALGYWIHWTQKGWKPDDWARLFVRAKDQEHLRAELIKKTS